MRRTDRFRSILAGLTSWEYVEQCDRYIDAACPDEPSSEADAVLGAAVALSSSALSESRMGPRMKDAIERYRESLTKPEGTDS